MNRKVIGISLIIVGVLVFLWATSSISSLPSAMFTPASLQDSLINGPQATYRIMQLFGAGAAAVGGIAMFAKA